MNGVIWPFISLQIYSEKPLDEGPAREYINVIPFFETDRSTLRNSKGEDTLAGNEDRPVRIDMNFCGEWFFMLGAGIARGRPGKEVDTRSKGF